MKQNNEQYKEALDSIFFLNNKFLLELKRKLGINYSIYIRNFEDLSNILAPRDYELLSEFLGDDYMENGFTWEKNSTNTKNIYHLSIPKCYFDDDNNLRTNIDSLFEENQIIFNVKKTDDEDGFPF